MSEQTLELIDKQTTLNDTIIHNEAQSQIKDDYISAGLIDLIKANEKLKDDIVQIELTDNSYNCENLENTDEGDPPGKKRKIKYKHKTEGQWVIGSVFEVQNDGNYEKYFELENTLDSNALNLMYYDWINAQSYEQLQDIIKDQTKDMTRDEFLNYLSYMTELLPYNDDKQYFIQEGDTQKPDDLWSMIQEVKKSWQGLPGYNAIEGDEFGGICGDIHFAALMIGQIARPDQFEYFTASYVVAGSQHVVTLAIDKDTGQAIVVNYDDVQIVDNPDGIESFSVKNSKRKGGFNNIGTNLRIFANSDGNAEHIATLKSALGSFIYNATVEKQNQTGAPIYNDFKTIGSEMSATRKIVKGKIIQTQDKDGKEIIKEKSKTYYITDGFKILKGSRENGDLSNTDIFTAVYYRKKTTNTDGQGNVLNPKKFGKESTFSLSGTHTNLGNINVNEDLYVVQLNYNYGLYKNILKTDKVDLQANGRININGDFYMAEETNNYGGTIGNSASGDGNLDTSVGLTGKFNISNKDQIKTYTSFDQTIGVKKERQLYDWAYLPQNVKLTTAAVRGGLNYKRVLTPKSSVSVGANFVGTQVGSLYNISTSYQNGKTYVYVNYQDNAKGLNPNISSNLLPNAGQRVTAGYGANDVNVFGTSADFGASITYLPKQKDFFIGGSAKININGKTKDKTKIKID